MLERLKYAMQGFTDNWRGSGAEYNDIATLQSRYNFRWALYDGSAFSDLIHRNPYRSDQRIYRNTQLLWKHVEAIVEFYAANVYRGDLPSQAPVGVKQMDGAVPFIVQAPDAYHDDVLRAIVELMIAWNWQMQMSQRPLYGAALGSVLTELVDDRDRRFAYPQIVWPGHVVDIELDYVNNVQSYTLEYAADEERNGQRETYRFRKEVDKGSFRYFRDDKPYDAFGEGAEVENPYGFVPAIWDIHRIGKPGDVRGRSAIDGTMQSLLQVNSIFSHAFDFQRKAFYAPIMIAGPASKRDTTLDTTPKSEKAEDFAQEFTMPKVPEGSQILQAEFDIGKTLEMLKEIQQGIVDENPEARFYQQLRGMATVATETAKILTEDAGSRLRSASDRYDVNTVKLFQMAIAMCGFRVNSGSWNTDENGKRVPLTQRQLAFSRFDLESYGRGELDMNIATRDLIEPTEQERLNLVRQKEAIQTPWGFAQMGVDETDASAIITARTESMWRSINGGSYRDLMNVGGEDS